MRIHRVVLLIAVLLATMPLLGQDPSPPKLEGIPILTGYGVSNFSFEPGEQSLQPAVNPILLVPFGQRWLVEAEGEFEFSFDHDSASGMWEKEYEKNVEYLQMDFLASKYLTVVGGRFLTPFGIFNERLHPAWVKNMLTTPFVTELEMSSSNGIMLRGGIPLSPNANLNYATYFSAASTVPALGATRAAGGRVSLFFPKQRLEIGASVQRTLQDTHLTSFGFDAIWQSSRVPFDLRAEVVRTQDTATGYWVEGAYRLRQFHNPFLRKSQAVVRMESYVPDMPGMGGMNGMDVPDVTTHRFMGGWNYYVNDALKFSFACGREFSSEGDHNVYTFGMAYRFTLPFERGKTQ